MHFISTESKTKTQTCGHFELRYNSAPSLCSFVIELGEIAKMGH